MTELIMEDINARTGCLDAQNMHAFEIDYVLNSEEVGKECTQDKAINEMHKHSVRICRHQPGQYEW